MGKKAEKWDRLAGEPELWYGRFDAYFRPLGPERSVEAAWRSWKRATGGSKGKRPSRHWFKNARKWHWGQRARAWDDKHRTERIRREENGIQEMLERHVEAAVKVFDKGLKYLEDHEIKSAETALRALKLAFSEERKAKGLPTHLLEIMKMTDEELLEKYREALGNLN